jgi:penicillin-binding protein 1C
VAAAERLPANKAERIALSIMSPAEGSVYLMDPTLRREFQTLALRATGAVDALAIQWSVDERSIGSSPIGKPMMWPLAPGPHRIEARDKDGNVAQVVISVK